MGICTMMAPRAEGKYKLQVTLINDGKKIHTTEEDLIVIAEADVKNAIKKVCFLDNSEESSDALAALTGPEQVIFTDIPLHSLSPPEIPQSYRPEQLSNSRTYRWNAHAKSMYRQEQPNG